MTKNDHIETALELINKENVNYILIEIVSDHQYKKTLTYSYQQKLSYIKNELEYILEQNGRRGITRKISNLKYVSHIVDIFKDTLNWFNPNIKLHVYWIFNYLNILNNDHEELFSLVINEIKNSDGLFYLISDSLDKNQQALELLIKSNRPNNIRQSRIEENRKLILNKKCNLPVNGQINNLINMSEAWSDCYLLFNNELKWINKNNEEQLHWINKYISQYRNDNNELILEKVNITPPPASNKKNLFESIYITLSMIHIFYCKFEFKDDNFLVNMKKAWQTSQRRSKPQRDIKLSKKLIADIIKISEKEKIAPEKMLEKIINSYRK